MLSDVAEQFVRQLSGSRDARAVLTRAHHLRLRGDGAARHVTRSARAAAVPVLRLADQRRDLGHLLAVRNSQLSALKMLTDLQEEKVSAMRGVRKQLTVH